jgi:hypothetical protein
VRDLDQCWWRHGVADHALQQRVHANRLLRHVGCVGDQAEAVSTRQRGQDGGGAGTEVGPDGLSGQDGLRDAVRVEHRDQFQ